jgi:hypothetical protein
MRDSLVPRVLLISYHDLLYRTETIMPLISRFLELEFDWPGAEYKADKTPQPDEESRREATLSTKERTLIQKHANRSAEAWILNRIDKQLRKPGLYTQETSKSAFATTLNEMEAKTWRLQQRVKELERDRKSRRRQFRELKNSRAWKLANKLSALRAKMTARLR